MHLSESSFVGYVASATYGLQRLHSDTYQTPPAPEHLHFTDALLCGTLRYMKAQFDSITFEDGDPFVSSPIVIPIETRPGNIGETRLDRIYFLRQMGDKAVANALYRGAQSRMATDIQAWRDQATRNRP